MRPARGRGSAGHRPGTTAATCQGDAVTAGVSVVKEAAEGNGEAAALPAGAGGRRGGRGVLPEAMGLVEGGGWKRGSLGLTSAGVSLRNP